MVNGAYITLQCQDTGDSNTAGSYFDGSNTKNTTLKADNFYKIVTNGSYLSLQRVSDGKYVGNSNYTVSMVDNLTDAVQFSSIAPATIGSWTSKGSNATDGTNTIRFTTTIKVDTDSYLLNVNSNAYAPKYWKGTGGFSVWQVKTYTESEMIDAGLYYKVSLTQPTGGSLKFSDNTTADKTLFYGTSVTVSQTTTSGYGFSNWTVGGSSVSTSPSNYTYDCSTKKPTVGSTVTISATYAELDLSKINFTFTNAATAVGSCADNVTVTATDNAGASITALTKKELSCNKDIKAATGINTSEKVVPNQNVHGTTSTTPIELTLELEGLPNMVVDKVSFINYGTNGANDALNIYYPNISTSQQQYANYSLKANDGTAVTLSNQGVMPVSQSTTTVSSIDPVTTEFDIEDVTVTDGKLKLVLSMYENTGIGSFYALTGISLTTKVDEVAAKKKEINADATYTATKAAYTSITGLTKDYPGYCSYAIWNTLYTAMNNENVTLDALNTAYTAFTGATAVIPSAGNFYRLKCAYTGTDSGKTAGQYLLSSTTNKSTSTTQVLAAATQETLSSTSVFHYDGNYMRTLNRGGVICKSDINVSWSSSNSSGTKFAFTKVDGQHYFTVYFGSARYLYGAYTGYTDSGSSTDTNGGYYWYLEPVQNDAYIVSVTGASNGSLTVNNTAYDGNKTLNHGSVYAVAVGGKPTKSDFTVTSVEGYTVGDPIIDNDKKVICLDYISSTDPNKRTIYDTSISSYPYRIPALTQLENGNVIAIGDYRWSGDDIGCSTVNNGRVDIVARESSDNGSTWASQTTLAQGLGDGSDYSGYGDAAVVTDWVNGETLMMTCNANGSDKFSTGNQQSSRFTAPKNSITFTRDDEHHLSAADKRAFFGLTGNEGAFFTSGRIFQSKTVKVGDYYRIYSALCVSGTNSYVVYSDDFGKTWKRLGTTTPAAGGNEAKVEELPDGRIVISSRKASGRYFNVFTYTNTEKAEGSWGTEQTNTTIASGDNSTSGTNGEILIVPATRTSDSKNVYVALQTAPAGTGRSNVTVYYKVLDTYTNFNSETTFNNSWTAGKKLSSTTSCYSTMILQKDGNIGLLYEEGLYNSGYNMLYDKRTLAELMGVEGYTVNTSLDRKAFLENYFSEAETASSWTDTQKKAFETVVATWKETPSLANLDAIHNFMASPYDYTVTIATSDANKGTVKFKDDETGATSKNLTSGTSVTVVATPASDSYEFVNWTNAVGGVMSSDASYTFNAAGDITLTANFKETVSNSVVIGTSTGNFINNDGETATGNNAAIKWESTTVNGLVLESDVTDDHMSFYNLNSGSFYFKTPVSADGSAYGTRNYYLKSPNRKIIGYEIKVECHKIGFTLTDNTFNQSVSASNWDSSEKTMSKSDISVDEIDFNLVVNHTTDEYLWVNSFTVYLEDSEAGTEIPVTIGSTGYASLYYGNVDLTVPESGVTAYTYVYDNGLKTKGYGAGSVIPAGVGVILKGDAGSYTFTASTPNTENNVKPTGLRMFGTDISENTTSKIDNGDKFYMLSRKDGVLGLYYGVSGGGAFTNAAHKAYLNLSSSEAGARTYIPFDFDTPTGIENIASGVDENATIYNIAGQRVANMKNGLYIVNGKKVIK